MVDVKYAYCQLNYKQIERKKKKLFEYLYIVFGINVKLSNRNTKQKKKYIFFALKTLKASTI